jgi:transcriptional regulator with XRE-family HTH domain
MKKRRRASANDKVSSVLRQTIRDRRLTAYAIAKQAGVSVDAVQRFLNDERGLNLDTVDQIADALHLTLCDQPQD